MIPGDYSRSHVSAVIDEYVFNERNRAILKRRLLDGITYDCLALEFQMSVRQVKAIVYKEEGRVFRHLS